MANPMAALPMSAALLSGSVKARPAGRKAALGPRPKAPTGIKQAPARKGLLPSAPMSGGGLPGC